MAFQAKWRDANLQRNAHAIRVRQDARANDPSMTPDERAHRIERLKSPLMAREHDQNVALGHHENVRQGQLVMREAIAADDDDALHWYGVRHV